MIEEILVNKVSFDLLILLLVALLAWVLLQIAAKKLINMFSTGTPRGRRLRTLSDVFKACGSGVILMFVVLQVFAILGINIAPLIASAGIIGLAVGFGSQALVRDVVTGFFMLAEDQFAERDEIEILGKRGIVEKIGVRTIYLRDEDGNLHIVPAGAVTVVTNYSRKKEEFITKKKKAKG